MQDLMLVLALTIAAGTPAALEPPAAASPPRSYLRLRGGAAFAIRELRLDGAVARVVAPDGTPLVLRTSAIEASGALPPAPAPASAPAAPRPRRPAATPAGVPVLDNRQLAAALVGSRQLSVIGVEPPLRAGRSRPPASEAGSADAATSAWKRRFDDLRRRWQALDRRRQDQLRALAAARAGGGGGPAGPAARALQREQRALGALEAKLHDLEAEYATLSEEARRQGVLPVAYRQGLR